MTKDYSKEVANLQKQITDCQGDLFRLLQRVMQERDSLDRQKEITDKLLIKQEQELEAAKRKIMLLETERNELRHYLRKQDDEAPMFVWGDVPIKTAKSDLEKLNKTVESLQKKLKEEAVELSAIAEKIQIRAETHGLAAANAMFDTVCLLLDDVPGWKKNKKTLETFFREYKKRANVENNFNAPVGMVIEKAK